MPTCADVFARTLRDAGITRMFGLPGGEILDFMDAARRVGIEFLLTRHEAAAAFMADVTGQITRRPGVCVSTLGPGAINMALGVANAYLDRSPLIAVSATHAVAAAPYATHQKLDLNAVYRPFTKLAITLDGVNTAEKVREAIEVSLTPRMGPVHIALPSDVARTEERDPTGDSRGVPSGDSRGVPAGDSRGVRSGDARGVRLQPDHSSLASNHSSLASNHSSPLPDHSSPNPAALDAVTNEIKRARRPVAILGLDLDPHADAAPVRAFVEALGLPVFVTPKAKGMFPEDHPLFHGVCAGVSGDAVVLDFLQRADLLVGIGFEPVESDKLWHHTMKMVSIGPVSIAADAYCPHAEAVGSIAPALAAIRATQPGPFEWTAEDRAGFRAALERVLRPASRRQGLSGYEMTRRLRELFPRDTILVTDVGSVKMVTTQAWTSYDPLTFFESNGLSAMSYSFPGAMAARLQFPDRPILCTIGDGGFGMTMGELETCVREYLHFVTVIFNDSSLSLIDAAQQRRGQPSFGVRYGDVDFAGAAAALGAWSERVETMEELDAAVREAMKVDHPAVIDAIVDPAEYVSHTASQRPVV